MANSQLKLVDTTTVNRTVVPPVRLPNVESRTRECLTDAEVAKLADAAKANRHGHRDATMVLLTYRHGLNRRRIGNDFRNWGAVSTDRRNTLS
jgi:hypothetical protein